jgi:hemoglobin
MNINKPIYTFLASALLALSMSTSAVFAQETVTLEEDDIALEEETIEDANAAKSADAQDEKTASTPEASTSVNPAPAHPELIEVYKQFGEEAGLIKLMDVFMVKLLEDPRMRPFFENSDQAKVKKHLVEQFCVILGGSCNYSGRDMKTTHASMNINRANFNALVEDLQWAMNKQGIPFRAQNKLLAKLAPMHREIESK